MKENLILYPKKHFLEKLKIIKYSPRQRAINVAIAFPLMISIQLLSYQVIVKKMKPESWKLFLANYRVFSFWLFERQQNAKRQQKIKILKYPRVTVNVQL